jgi:hypothetical protein
LICIRHIIVYLPVSDSKTRTNKFYIRG